MYSYDTYLEHNDTLSFEEANRIHQKMLAEIGHDPDAEELYLELVQSSVEYASVRSKWLLMSREERMDADSGRTGKHDSLIIKFLQLQRYLQANGKQTDWLTDLTGGEDIKDARKRVGDMGCYIAFVYGLNAR